MGAGAAASLLFYFLMLFCPACCPLLPQIPRWDTSKLRAKGARLKTFGGRASGPEPLEALFLFAVNMFQHARGRRLTPLEAHDLVCKVAEIVVVGGVRR
jgi:ribonucleoside-diphosphate reductase alpha chain